ncbi:MAG TPA: DMT family transporter [Hypericibacter adhaerens]|jgi:drug/metabolite transporter (DMT)-like permease|uniref:Membrane protein n=1 Tax=Hypericibacter adhaerens TaxID=2602016 RepID=A0A5J6MVX4_9PROT|nr:DMT family transporter [Hypericibacter adhaerens]QEX21354.1 membrane protein [Hypericibacter adhaerens]HWA42967.1 DMT family transporter [Hypericibacter adhaerens]
MAASAESTPRERLLAGLGLLVTSLCWGSMVPGTASLLASVDPFFLAACRYLIAVPALALTLLLTERRRAWPSYLPWGHILLLGAIGMGGWATCLTLGVYFSDPITVTAISAAGPVVSAVLARSFDHRPLTRAAYIGMVLAVIGGLIVALFKPGQVLALGFRGGEFIIIAGMSLWTLYSIKAQQWLSPLGLSQLRVTLLTAGAAAIGLWVIFVIALLLGFADAPTEMPSLRVLAELLWLGIGPTALGVVFWNMGVARLGVAISALYTNLSPVISVLLAVLFLGAETTGLQILGGLVVLAGVIWMQLYGLRAAAR